MICKATGLKRTVDYRIPVGEYGLIQEINRGLEYFWAKRARPAERMQLERATPGAPTLGELAGVFIAMGKQPRGALTHLAKQHGVRPGALRIAVNRERARRCMARIRNTLTT